jgi:hypothetical protein
MASKAVGLMMTGASFWQASSQHKKSLECEQTLHEKEMENMRKHFETELSTTRSTYLLSMYVDMETYFQELNENLISSSRDAERDMVDQRNQQFQTILLSATIMLTALLNILFQGYLPENINNWFYVSYSLANTLSLITLTISIALCIVLVGRVARFMTKRARSNIDYLRTAMLHTQKMMRNMRVRQANSNCNNNNNNNHNNNINDINDPLNTNQYHDNAADANHSRHYRLTGMTDDEVEACWKQHEDQVSHYLNTRRMLSEQLEGPTDYDDDFEEDDNDNNYDNNGEVAVIRRGRERQHNERRIGFEQYWASHCALMGEAAFICFYLGTVWMLMATMIFLWPYFVKSYNSSLSAYVTVITIGLSLTICLAVAIYLRYFDQSILSLQRSLDRENDLANNYLKRLTRNLNLQSISFRSFSRSASENKEL